MTFVFYLVCIWREIYIFFQVHAGAMVERSGEDDDSNDQDEIKNK